MGLRYRAKNLYGFCCHVLFLSWGLLKGSQCFATFFYSLVVEMVEIDKPTFSIFGELSPNGTVSLFSLCDVSGSSFIILYCEKFLKDSVISWNYENCCSLYKFKSNYFTPVTQILKAEYFNIMRRNNALQEVRGDVEEKCSWLGLSNWATLLIGNVNQGPFWVF